MYLKDNKLQGLKNHFLQELSSLYDEREVENIFHILCEDFLSIKRNEYFNNKDNRISESEILLFHYALKDLKKNKPVQYITGKTVFYGYNFMINEHVLIPRPETEELVYNILQRNKNSNKSVLDIATGSGCIACSLKKENISFSVYATDVSDNTLATAKKNSLALNTQIKYIKDDILNYNISLYPQHVDIIVSNPPYVLEDDKIEMNKNVLEHEPHIALFVTNNDPLQFYKKICSLADRILSADGEIWFEAHEKYANKIADLLVKHHYKDIEIINDLNQKPRIVFGIKKN